MLRNSRRPHFGISYPSTPTEISIHVVLFMLLNHSDVDQNRINVNKKAFILKVSLISFSFFIHYLICFEVTGCSH